MLGLSALRFPVLWERVSPDDPASADWAWSDQRLAELRSRAIRPIVGLIHHGSGPIYTDLLAEGFAAGLARHARAVAERYPWVEDWTPVNEPCTTARFSCLYGHWYPHRRDERSFWLALLNQIDATRLAMRAVRAVTSTARLIQTDDLGRAFATAAAGDQAGFDNQRRWMGWDLLAGRVVPGHAFWSRLVGFGFEPRLRAIADDPCPPDIIGINHYLTSDRFLDHRVGRYVPAGTDRRFADTEAVRVLTPPPPGPLGALREAWDRYRRPLAVTEAHNGCTREEQMRWMLDSWRGALQLRADGVDVRAVTSWALFGSQGWNTLLTASGTYEAGVYDVRGATPRATAMVPLLAAIAAGREPDHPVLQGQGWWRRDLRLTHPASPRPAPMREYAGGVRSPPPRHRRPILILGATGTLGMAFAAACRHRDLSHVRLSRSQVDLGDEAAIARALDLHQPWVVVNAAGWVRVDEAETRPQACFDANAHGAIRVARCCAERDIATIGFSSDLVFDGTAARPYVERDAPRPRNVYGHSKAEAERGIGALPGTHLVVRTAAFFSPCDPHNFASQAIRSLAAGRHFAAADDQIVTPTYVPDLCNAVLDLAIDGEGGIWHLAGDEALSWADFARRLAVTGDFDADLVIGGPGRALGWRAERPVAVFLDSERGRLLPGLDAALARFFAAKEIAPADPDPMPPLRSGFRRLATG